MYSGFSGSKTGYMNGLVRAGATMLALANGCSVPACMGAIFRSADGGTSWQQAAQPQDWVVGIWPTSDSELFVGGTALLRSRDAGASFDKVALPVDKQILALWGAGDERSTRSGRTERSCTARAERGRARRRAPRYGSCMNG